ncbi:hypothetical protein [Modicisalibacter sp. MOD 31.J]|uniref:hypothetical protein n=1 Tax=Modicisalibacter sp. MOD 31.J TaxID=2831897 RepID=UPI001CCF0F2A|nr:hypothetical protein [Modicisalibacter sp. MOD 31.J]MBZ9575369.1 hypothetical protein [Modicisalibacter sp. MOD 31.J]
MSGIERGISPFRRFLLRDFGPSMIREVNHIENGMPIPKNTRFCAQLSLMAISIKSTAGIIKTIEKKSFSDHFILFSHLIRNLSLSLLDWLGLLFHPCHERPGILGGPQRITPVAHLIIGEPAATGRMEYAPAY